MNNGIIRHSITSLRMIFWGGLLCLIDFNIASTRNGQGFRFDILNDAVGAILIAVGVFRLSEAPVHRRYADVMLFVKVVAVIAVLDAIRSHVITPLPPIAHMFIHLLGLVMLGAIVAFCIAMRWFSEEARLYEAIESWSVTTLLFVVIYALPLGFFYLAGGFATMTGRTFQFNLGPAGLLLIPVFAIPLIHLFVSTSRMQRAAEDRLETDVEKPPKDDPHWYPR